MESADQTPSGSQPQPATPAPGDGSAGPAGRAVDSDSAALASDAKEPRFGFVGYSANGVQVSPQSQGQCPGQAGR